MILVNTLFERDGVTCPSWLSSQPLEANWMDSIYSLEDGIHKWVLKNQIQNLAITFDGEEYVFCAFNKADNDLVLFKEVITEDCALIT